MKAVIGEWVSWEVKDQSIGGEGFVRAEDRDYPINAIQYRILDIQTDRSENFRFGLSYFSWNTRDRYEDLPEFVQNQKVLVILSGSQAETNIVAWYPINGEVELLEINHVMQQPTVYRTARYRLSVGRDTEYFGIDHDSLQRPEKAVEYEVEKDDLSGKKPYVITKITFWLNRIAGSWEPVVP